MTDTRAPRAGSRTRGRESALSRAVGVTGELLVTLGVLVGLFVAWQLWWTDVTAAREHTRVVRTLEWKPPPEKTVADRHRADPPAVHEPTRSGSVFATFYVPRWGPRYEVPIAQGVDKRTVLDTKGIGHYPDTAMPGGLGNFALAAHRTTFGKPFNRIASLRKGDPVVVLTDDTWYVYRVTARRIVAPYRVDVVAPVPGRAGRSAEPGKRLITLTTCHPKYSARERFVVHGEMDYWAPVGEGTPQELLDVGANPSAFRGGR